MVKKGLQILQRALGSFGGRRLESNHFTHALPGRRRGAPSRARGHHQGMCAPVDMLRVTGAAFGRDQLRSCAKCGQESEMTKKRVHGLGPRKDVNGCFKL